MREELASAFASVGVGGDTSGSDLVFLALGLRDDEAVGRIGASILGIGVDGCGRVPKILRARRNQFQISFVAFCSTCCLDSSNHDGQLPAPTNSRQPRRLMGTILIDSSTRIQRVGHTFCSRASLTAQNSIRPILQIRQNHSHSRLACRIRRHSSPSRRSRWPIPHARGVRSCRCQCVRLRS